MRRLLSLAILFLVTGCSGSGELRPVAEPLAPRPDAGDTAAELAALHEAKDYFAMRDLLAERQPVSPVDAAYYRAVVAKAFNRLEEAQQALEDLLSWLRRDDGRYAESQELLLGVHLRRHRYAEARKAARAVLASLGSADDDPKDVRNLLRLLDALADVPPQEVRAPATTVVEMSRGPEGGQRLPLTIQGRPAEMLFDTGANYSMLMRSEAQALGLAIRPADLEVGTTTDRKILADLAVADEVRLGEITWANVVFLVVPDELLSFPEAGIRIPGLLGFPVMEAVGEIRLLSGDRLEIPAQAPERPLRNFALDDLEPLVRVEAHGRTLLCRFDTGADSTTFYRPFYLDSRKRVRREGRRLRSNLGGVGGLQKVRAYELPRLPIAVGGLELELGPVEVLTEPIASDDDGALDCNLGQDAVAQADRVVVNFRSMSLVMEPPPE